MERHVEAARLTNPDVVCVGVSIDTSSMDEEAATEYLDEIEDMLDVPCVDPLKTGVGRRSSIGWRTCEARSTP